MSESFASNAARVTTLKDAINSTLYQCMDCGEVVTPVLEDGVQTCPSCGVCDQGFEEIPGEEAIEYIVARLRRMKGRADGAEAQYKTVLELLKRDKERAERRLAGFIRWYQPTLKAYYEANAPKKKKSLDVGGLTFGYRSTAAGLELVGEQPTKGNPEELETLHEALRWAKEHAPAFVKTELSLKWGELKKWIASQETPVSVPGVTTTPAVETFFVKL